MSIHYLRIVLIVSLLTLGVGTMAVVAYLKQRLLDKHLSTHHTS